METTNKTNKKALNKFAIAQIRSFANGVKNNLVKIQALDSKIEKLQAEKEMYKASMDGADQLVKNLAKGYGINDLMVLVEKKAMTKDKDGNPKETIVRTLVFKYPETILPPVEDGNDDDPDTEEDAEDNAPETTQEPEAADAANPVEEEKKDEDDEEDSDEDMDDEESESADDEDDVDW